MNQIINTVVQQALPGAVALLATIGAYILARVSSWIMVHVKNPAITGILIRLENLAATVVAEAEGTLVDQLRTNGAPLTAAQGKQVLDSVLAKLRQHLGAQGLAEIEGVVKPGDLNALLISFIESANQRASVPSVKP
jgi:hypothetical protein